MRLLDEQDRSVNADMPMLQGLTNGGPANLGLPMNMPAYQPQNTVNTGVFGSTPSLLGDLSIEDDDEWNDTDPMSFEDDQIYDQSAFLGIRIGKKAKARGVVKKAARVAKREARRAAKNASVENIGAESPWKQPDLVTPDNYNPLSVQQENPAMLSTLNNAANTASAQLGLGNPNATGTTGFEDVLNEFENGYRPNNPPKKEKANNNLLFVGIGAAVLIVVVIALKKK